MPSTHLLYCCTQGAVGFCRVGDPLPAGVPYSVCPSGGQDDRYSEHALDVPTIQSEISLQMLEDAVAWMT